MSSSMHELQIPPAVESAEQAIELARIWAANNGQHVSINVEVWDDPAYWGMMLVDLARHIAKAYNLSGSMGEAAALARLKAGFDAEWNFPTDMVKGERI